MNQSKPENGVSVPFELAFAEVVKLIATAR
ncbi:hypothetical protein HDE74_000503 [Janthinobacterium sp. K2Li3]|nr:hypothetical protein [Janthinobacterium sp. K2C7]MBB5379817.1 hypothetical protein [Janthinobacterium sp. K2Li3]MBB5386087.1 hypothetical protein [Janthinobacterium sp. K2E3]